MQVGDDAYAHVNNVPRNGYSRSRTASSSPLRFSQELRSITLKISSCSLARHIGEFQSTILFVEHRIAIAQACCFALKGSEMLKLACFLPLLEFRRFFRSVARWILGFGRQIFLKRPT